MVSVKEIGQTYRTVMENDDLDVEIKHLNSVGGSVPMR